MKCSSSLYNLPPPLFSLSLFLSFSPCRLLFSHSFRFFYFHRSLRLRHRATVDAMTTPARVRSEKAVSDKPRIRESVSRARFVFASMCACACSSCEVERARLFVTTSESLYLVSRSQISWGGGGDNVNRSKESHVARVNTCHSSPQPSFGGRTNSSRISVRLGD